MSKLWDDLKKNMKDWSTAAVEKAEEVSKIAVAKTEELTKISKVKIEIHQLQRDKAKSFERIGRLVYDHFQNKKTLKVNELEEVNSLREDIDRLIQSIQEKELEIEKIKEEHDIADEGDILDAELVDTKEDTPEETVEEAKDVPPDDKK